MRQMRQGRRELKSTVYRSRVMSDVDALRSPGTQYLRYVPQRWMALAPVMESSSLPGSEGYALLYAELRKTAEVMGWSLTDSAGSVFSLGLDGTSTAYLFASLASPPMPAFTGHRVIDGGCYIALGPEHGGPGCDGEHCAECARFGREPSGAELFDWSVRARQEPWLGERTVMADSLDAPYPTGMWSEYLKQRFGEGDGGARPEPPDGKRPHRPVQPKSCTVKPRMMPHEVALPIGMTACVMPAGIYLCYQCREGGQSAAHERMLGLAAGITHREFTLEDEIAASKASRISMDRDNQPDTGPVAEPFATSRAAGDPAMVGWNHSAGQSVLRQLVVPTNMALPPEDGYCITCSVLPPEDRNDPASYEMQLLVDASALVDAEGAPLQS